MEIYERLVAVLPEDIYYDSETHGITHCRRVALLGNMILSELHGNQQDEIAFTVAALLHDIGRSDDWECQRHGSDSFEKAIELNLWASLPYDISESEREVIRQMMVFHCIPDSKIPFEKMDERTAFMVRVLKDADGLDRLRFDGLDTRFLRFNVSKQFVPIAKKLLQTEV